MSHREAEIALLVLEGRTEGDVARILSLSVHTVHTYVGRVYRQLAVRNRAEFAHVIYEQLLLERLNGTRHSDVP
ncbi:MAG: helix-turn-helix transcriptional regulator [Gemmatimonadota bacterium]|nr:helix-turn-helix transcriptional regulator [Gemmatimonadota bacterium]